MITGSKWSWIHAAKTYWATKSYNSMRMIDSNKAACGYNLLSFFDSPEVIRDNVLELLELYRQGKIKPRVDSIWAFEEVKRKHQLIILFVYFGMVNILY